MSSKISGSSLSPGPARAQSSPAGEPGGHPDARGLSLRGPDFFCFSSSTSPVAKRRRCRVLEAKSALKHKGLRQRSDCQSAKQAGPEQRFGRIRDAKAEPRRGKKNHEESHVQ